MQLINAPSGAQTRAKRGSETPLSGPKSQPIQSGPAGGGLLCDCFSANTGKQNRAARRLPNRTRKVEDPGQVPEQPRAAHLAAAGRAGRRATEAK